MPRRSVPRARAILAVALSAGGAAACGGGAYQGSDGTTGSNTGGSAGATSSTAVSGSGGSAAGPGTSACDHYFAAQYLRCGGPVPPASEATRAQSRFVQVCLNDIALPGSGMTPASVEACASALDSSQCGLPDGPPVACNFNGSLPGGAPCNEGLQCQSGQCQGTVSDSPGGQIGPFTCGTCTPVVAIGQVCGQGNFSAGCPAGAICATRDTSAPMPTYTCTAVVEGDVGATCDGLSAICKTGLYCAQQTGQCTALGAAGAACGEGPPPGYPGGCAAPLGCVGLPGAAICSNGTAGAFCLTDFDCSPGLGCVPIPFSGPHGAAPVVDQVGCSPSGTCEPAAWAASAQACDGYSTRCLVGSCGGSCGPTGAVPGTCPSVVADGQPCPVQGVGPAPSGPTCDISAECFSPVGKAGAPGLTGTCTLLDSIVCH
jgi:hypothetical protein